MVSLQSKAWWKYVHEDIQELLLQSFLLLKTASEWGKSLPESNQEFHDYAFIVFPAAKAYEGFLKKLFFDMHFISDEDYFGKRFRIGRALNPALENDLRAESVYDRLVNYCNGRELPDALWDTWKNCRNLLFHWFPNEKNAITLEEARQRVDEVINTLDLAYNSIQENSGLSARR